MTLEERLFSKIENTEDCWIWVGAKNHDGYGVLTNRHGIPRQLRAHRLMYELLIGDIPKGLIIDHLCHNRACENPNHMEPVTNAENIKRGFEYDSTGHNKTQGICRAGLHELDGYNLLLYERRDEAKLRIERRCRECQLEYQRKHRKHLTMAF